MKNEKNTLKNSDDFYLLFYSSVIYKDNKPTIVFRKSTNDKKLIKKVVDEITEKGYFEFKGKIIFKDVFKSIKYLSQLGLIDEKEITKPKTF